MTGAGEGNAEWLDVPGLDARLHELERLLDDHLARGAEEADPDLIVLLDKLWDVWRPRLLDRFRARRGTPLEEKLTEWLIRLKPPEGDESRKPGRTTALGVLRKIRGNGFGRVIGHYMDGMSGESRARWISYASKATPERGTIEGLFGAAMSEEQFEFGDRLYPQRQMEAMQALAGAKAWGELFRAVIRWGTSCYPDVLSCRAGQEPLGDDLCRPALEALVAGGDPGAGPILALAFAGRKDQLERIRGVCRE